VYSDTSLNEAASLFCGGSGSDYRMNINNAQGANKQNFAKFPGK
jgi:hypothetical protein